MWEDGKGQWGFVTFDRYHKPQWEFSCGPVPQCVVDTWVPSKSKIGQAEIYGAIMPYFSLPASRLKDRECIHFVDNTSACAGLFKGYSPKADSACMLGRLHIHLATLRVIVWWAYVASKANVSDGPSRYDFALVCLLGASWTAPAIINGAWLLSPLESLLPATRKLCGSMRRRKRKAIGES